MQTRFTAAVNELPEARELDSIIRACVHCGFCNATCPTYELLGDELDGPRGRIYLLKQMLEGQPVTQITQQHLDRCLTCRACETTCPSGVRYGRLLDLGRPLVDAQVHRSFLDQIRRWGMLQVFPYPQRFTLLLKLAGLFRPLLSREFQKKISPAATISSWPESSHYRKMLILPGCVQGVLAPTIDFATAKVLERLGISLISVNNEAEHQTGGSKSGCCGALNYHLGKHAAAMQFARNNIDACWPYIERGAENIVTNASGCGVMLKEYGQLLQHDPAYAAKAVKFSSLVKDISEILAQEDLSIFTATKQNIVFQSPCTLQHGQKLGGQVESILRRIGWHPQPVAEAHICCGSAGVYSLLQAELSSKLLNNKLAALLANEVDIILTANIGCLTHLQSATDVKVKHWIELLAMDEESNG